MCVCFCIEGWCSLFFVAAPTDDDDGESAGLVPPYHGPSTYAPAPFHVMTSKKAFPKESFFVRPDDGQTTAGRRNWSTKIDPHHVPFSFFFFFLPLCSVVLLARVDRPRTSRRRGRERDLERELYSTEEFDVVASSFLLPSNRRP